MKKINVILVCFSLFVFANAYSQEQDMTAKQTYDLICGNSSDITKAKQMISTASWIDAATVGKSKLTHAVDDVSRQGDETVKSIDLWCLKYKTLIDQL